MKLLLAASADTSERFCDEVSKQLVQWWPESEVQRGRLDAPAGLGEQAKGDSAAIVLVEGLLAYHEVQTLCALLGNVKALLVLHDSDHRDDRITAYLAANAKVCKYRLYKKHAWLDMTYHFVESIKRWLKSGWKGGIEIETSLNGMHEQE